jgi:DNA-binding PadR family transcriptional regulator
LLEQDSFRLGNRLEEKGLAFRSWEDKKGLKLGRLRKRLLVGVARLHRWRGAWRNF